MNMVYIFKPMRTFNFIVDTNEINKIFYDCMVRLGKLF